MSGDIHVVTAKKAFQVSGSNMAVDWTGLEFGIRKVRAVFVEKRGDEHVVIRSTRSGALFCVPLVNWRRAGGRVG